jgi:hypothetical protein
VTDDEATDRRVVPISSTRRPSGARGAAAVAAGAARAAGERSRRRRTPLIAAGPEERVQPASPQPRTRRRADRSAEDGAARPAAAVRTDEEPLPQHETLPQDASSAGREPAAVVRYLVESVVEAVVAEGRRAGVDDIEERVATALAFLRRRLTGDYEVDDFGFDAELTEALLPVLRPLYRSWFRVEVRGIENVPAEGGALIVANHSGAIALDAVMTQLAVHDEHPAHRHLRLLGADLVFALPVVGELARKTGTTLATTADAELLLGSGELVGVWPEGFKGVGKPFSERYKLQRFGRGGFVAAALAAKRRRETPEADTLVGAGHP